MKYYAIGDLVRITEGTTVFEVDTATREVVGIGDYPVIAEKYLRFGTITKVSPVPFVPHVPKTISAIPTARKRSAKRAY